MASRFLYSFIMAIPATIVLMAIFGLWVAIIGMFLPSEGVRLFHLWPWALGILFALQVTLRLV